jgi:hypothetical protein
MSLKVELAEIKRALQSTSGLHEFGPHLLITLLTHPHVVCKMVKDVGTMSDTFVFFVYGEVVLVINLPWSELFLEPDKKLTERYKFLLDRPNSDDDASINKLAQIKKIVND